MNYIERAKKFRAKKRLGQNFLVDADAIETIIEQANISNEETVVEIGPGLGFVTEQLAESSKRVIAIEVDYDAIDELMKLPYDNIEIIDKDVLKTDISELVKESSEPVKIVANIPYYITSPILVHLLGEIDEAANKNRNVIKEIFLMVQLEVAQRIVATEKSPNKQYGTLSILCNYWCETELIKKVPAKSFLPKPKVDSAIIKLTVREKPSVEVNNPKLYRRVVQACFKTRRKTIKNALSFGGFNKEVIDKALADTGIDFMRRGETLSMQEFADLTDKIELLSK